MKAITALLALGVYVNVWGQNYNLANAQQDSLLIYQAYKDEIPFLDCAAQDIDRPRWFARSQRDDSLTNYAKQRLSTWNNAPYQPVDEENLESYGTAYYFPQPRGLKRPGYSIMDLQVKFITRKDGKTERPYVERIYFSDQNELLKIERIDPVSADWEESRVLISEVDVK